MSVRVAMIVLLAAACAPNNPVTGDSAIEPEPDAFTSPGAVTIRVQNDGARTLYVQASGWSGPAVTSILKAGEIAVGRDTCEICNCATCPSCAVCGRSIARVAELLPGAAIDFTWDQIDWSTVEDGCRPTLACEQANAVPPGALTARAQYSDSFTTTTDFGPEESFIGPVLTADTVFQHPASGAVIVPIL